VTLPERAATRLGDSALALVAAYIDSEDETVAEAAILALGAARSGKAFAFRKAKWGQRDAKKRRGPR
jgi:hypothetical protein